jgi:kinesin family protein C2/C3
MEVFAKGTENRATATTNMNEHSSRSHLILQVTVTTTVHGETPVTAKLTLVDLAGSERVGKSGVVGLAMKEAQHINKSLSALGDVMEPLDMKNKHVPYRFRHLSNENVIFVLRFIIYYPKCLIIFVGTPS